MTVRNDPGDTLATVDAELIAKPEPTLTVARPPEVVLREAQEAARALAEVIAGKKRKLILNGEQYLEFEDWATVGRFYGVTAKAVGVEWVDLGEHGTGFHAKAQAVNGAGQVISAAEAWCLDSEPSWAHKPIYQLASMAQTRAAAKALRMVLSWVVVLAGFRPTPVEEMELGASKPPIKMPERQSARPADPAPDEPPAETPDTISVPQQKMLFAKAKAAGLNSADVQAIVHGAGYEHTKDIPKAEFDNVLAELAKKSEPPF